MNQRSSVTEGAARGHMPREPGRGRLSTSASILDHGIKCLEAGVMLRLLRATTADAALSVTTIETPSPLQIEGTRRKRLFFSSSLMQLHMDQNIQI